ncbi:Protein of unknown function (DUF1765) [Plasmodiophora brassicae]
MSGRLYAGPAEDPLYPGTLVEPWSGSFARHVAGIESCQALPMQLRMLEDLKVMFDKHSFSYRNDAEFVSGVNAILRLASLVLEILQKSFGVKRDVLGALLIRSLERSELRLFIHPSAVKLAEPLRPLYINLLHRVWGYVKQQVTKPVDSKARTSFCLRISGILYLRLPAARCGILEALDLYADVDPASLSEPNAALLAELEDDLLRTRPAVRDSFMQWYNLLQHPDEWGSLTAEGQGQVQHADPIVPDCAAVQSLKQLAEKGPHSFTLSFVAGLFRQLQLIFTGLHPVRYDLIDSYGVVVRRAFLAFIHLGNDDRAHVSAFAKPIQLLALCIRATLYGTRVHDRAQIGMCLDTLDVLIEGWAKQDPLLGNPRTCLPFPQTGFCFDELRRALSILLADEDYQVLIRTLCFISAHMSRYYGRPRFDLVQGLLIDTHFFKLFLHWHRLVREAYHVLLVFKVRRGTSQPVSSATSNPTRTSPEKGLLASFLSMFMKPAEFPTTAPPKDDIIDSGAHEQLSVLETPLERVMRLTKQRDAAQLLDMCQFDVCRCDMDSDDEAMDAALWIKIECHVNMVMKGPGCTLRLARAAAEEFKHVQDLAKSLQMRHLPNPGSFETLHPVLTYEIRTALNDAI